MDGLRDASLDRVAWILVALGVVAVAAYTVYATIGGIVLGVFLYYGTRPVYDRVHDRVDHPGLSAAITLSTVGVPMVLVLAYAGFVGYRELTQLLDSPVTEDVVSLLRPYVDVDTLRDREQWIAFVRTNSSILRRYTGRAFAWAVRLFVTVTVAYYLLRDGDDVAAWIRDTFGPRTVELAADVDADLAHIYAGNLLTIAITAVIAAVTFYAFDLLAPGGTVIAYPILLGLLVGLGTLVPGVGMLAVYVPYAGLLVVRAVAWNTLPVWVPVAFLGVTFVVVDTFPDIVLRSYVSKGDINMGLMILSYVLGARAFGWYGVFLGPIVLVAFIYAARRVLPRFVDG